MSIGAGEGERERDRFRFRRRHEGRDRPFALGVDRGLLRHLSHLRQERGLGKGGEVARRFAWFNRGQAPHMPLKLASLGHDVVRRSAFDGADGHGRVGRLEALVVLSRRDTGADTLQFPDQSGRGGNRVDAEIGHARMRLAPRDARAVGVDALMRVDHRHAGRLADDDGARPRQISPETGDQRPDTGAPDLLVIGDDDVDRLFQGPRLEGRHRGERASDKALHVAAAAAVKLAVALGQRERVGSPALTLDRHAVAVTREADAAMTFGPDGGEQTGLGAVSRGHARRGDAVALEVILDEGDQREIRLGAGGVEGHELGKQIAYGRISRRQRVFLAM